MNERRLRLHGSDIHTSVVVGEMHDEPVKRSDAKEMTKEETKGSGRRNSGDDMKEERGRRWRREESKVVLREEEEMKRMQRIEEGLR